MALPRTAMGADSTFVIYAQLASDGTFTQGQSFTLTLEFLYVAETVFDPTIGTCT